MNQDQVVRTVGQGRTENPVLSRPWLRSIVPLRLREVRPRKGPRSGTGAWHPASKLLKSLPMGSPSQDRDAGSNPAGATNLFLSMSSAKVFRAPSMATEALLNAAVNYRWCPACARLGPPPQPPVGGSDIS